MSLPDHLVALRDEALHTSCDAWAIRKRWPLRTSGQWRSGPCPNCGGDDRFWISAVKNTYGCRNCGISGQGSIALVMDTQKVEFVEACEIITGHAADKPIEPEQAEANARSLEAKKREDEARSEKYRQDARKAGKAIYGSGAAPAADGPVLQYLSIRAIDFSDHPAIRSVEELPIRERLDLPYVEVAPRGGYEVLHTGPGMLWPIRLPARLVQPGDPLGSFGGVHQTWIDLDQPKGKVVLYDPDRDDGKPLPAKKMRGSKQGGMIPLFTPPAPRRIVMGEGIETTLTPFCHAFEPDTAYWAAGDIGNMSGKAFYRLAKRHEDRPDMTDLGCFLVPEWCEELVFLAENDEAHKHPIEKCTRGLLRNRWLRQMARRERPDLPELRTVLVRPGGGFSDLNDVAMDDIGPGAADHPKTTSDGTIGAP